MSILSPFRIRILGLIAVLGLLVLSLPLAGVNKDGTAGRQVQTASAQTEITNLTSVPPQNPILTDLEKQTIVGAALNAPGVKSWSSTGWQFVTMDFVGINQPTVQWQYAIVNLHLPSNVNAPIACDEGWWAMVKVNLVTKQVVSEDEPSTTNAICHSTVTGGPIPTINSARQNQETAIQLPQKMMFNSTACMEILQKCLHHLTAVQYLPTRTNMLLSYLTHDLIEHQASFKQDGSLRT